MSPAPKNGSTRNWISAALIALLPIMLAACGHGTGEASSQDQSLAGGPANGMTVAQMRSEYRSEQAKLNLNPSWVWPGDSVFKTKAADGSLLVYQRGYGRQAADLRWFCSWVDQVVSPKVSDHQRDEALLTALTIKDTYFYKVSLEDSSKQFFGDMLSKAELGDRSVLATDYKLNCDKSAP